MVKTMATACQDRQCGRRYTHFFPRTHIMVKAKVPGWPPSGTNAEHSPLPYQAQAEVRSAGRPSHIPSLLIPIPYMHQELD